MSMDKLIKKLEDLQTLLKKKTMSFKAGQNLSSPSKPSTSSVKAPEAPKPASPKAPTSKKDPVMVAEQIQNPDTKKQVMKEAIKISKAGQWSLTKAEPEMASPDNPEEGRTRNKKSKGESDLLYPGIEHASISKDEDGPHYHILQDGQQLTTKPVPHNEIVRKYGSVQEVEAAGYRLKPATPSTDVEKQDDSDLDAKIRAKLKAEMDKRNFTEVDTTKHIIDRDRGEKAPKAPQPNKLLN